MDLFLEDAVEHQIYSLESGKRDVERFERLPLLLLEGRKWRVESMIDALLGNRFAIVADRI